MEQIVISKASDLSETLLRSLYPIISVSDAKQVKELNGANEVSLTVESAVPLELTIGDYAVIFGERYTINQLPNPEKKGDRRFVTTIKMESAQYDLLRVQFFNTDVSGFNTSPDFTLTGNLAFFCGVVVNNANRVFSGQWSTGSMSSTGDKTISFNEDNCLGALQKICQEFETEFKVSQSSDNKSITIGTFGSILGTTFEYGKGKGLYNLSRQTLNDKSVVNRLYLFGGTKNIPPNYRNFSQRLTIQGGYIQDNASISAFGIIEGVKTYEDIFPKRKGTVTFVGGQLVFADESMNFDIKDSLIEGMTAKVSFVSGGLSGYTFDVKKYDAALKAYTLMPFQDERGLELPSATLPGFTIDVGDEYILENILLPSSYITEAETKLLSEGQIFLDQNKAPRVQYSLTFDEYYFKDLYSQSGITNVFEVGDYVTINDEDLSIINGTTRIIGIERDCLFPYRYVLTIADSYEITLIEKIIAQGKTQKQIIKLNKLYDATKAKIGWRNTQELLAMTFDTDGYFDTGNIRPLSIETSMLVVGVKSQQLILRVVIEPNFEGNINVVKVNAGILVQYLVEETIRTWQIAAQTVTIPDNGARYIYGKCHRTNYNDGMLIFSTEQIKPDDDANYYHFLIGVLHSVTEGVRWISLTYGATAINGRFIKTGRIQSFSGETYFDLDMNEIAGKISFIDANGDYVDLDQFNQDVLDFINTTYTGDKTLIQNQIDGKIEAWFQDSDPNTWPESERAAHNGDMWYHLTNKKLYRYKASTNTWERIEDQDALDAYEAASKAQDTADGKRRVFVAEPYPPYDVGDLWTDGTDLRRCVTTRLTGSYNPLDWNLATRYDNTKTTIDGGIVTSGRIQLAGDDFNIKAGITGQGTDDSSVRFWAGTDYGNRAVAPCRILQSGAIFFRQKLVLTNSSNDEQAGISGDDGSGDTNVRFWSGSNYASRGSAPFRVFADGTFVSTKGSFGVLQIAGSELRNDFNSDASIIIRKDWMSQSVAIGTDVYPPSGGNKGTAKFEQGASNGSGWNIGVEARAFGSTFRNVALYVSEGELLANRATLNGRSTYSETFNDNTNRSVDVSQYDVLNLFVNGSYPTAGVNFVGGVSDGKQVVVINSNNAKPVWVWSTARAGNVELAGGEVVTFVYSGGYWYIISRYNQDF